MIQQTYDLSAHSRSRSENDASLVSSHAWMTPTSGYKADNNLDIRVSGSVHIQSMLNLTEMGDIDRWKLSATEGVHSGDNMSSDVTPSSFPENQSNNDQWMKHKILKLHVITKGDFDFV